MRELADCILHVYLQGFFNSSCVGIICSRILLVVLQQYISRLCSFWTCCISKLHPLSIWPWGRVSFPRLCIVCFLRLKVALEEFDILFMEPSAPCLHLTVFFGDFMNCCSLRVQFSCGYFLADVGMLVSFYPILGGYEFVSSSSLIYFIFTEEDYQHILH